VGWLEMGGVVSGESGMGSCRREAWWGWLGRVGRMMGRVVLVEVG
jgi:hypothetical protein